MDDIENFWKVWEVISSYIPKKDVSDALEELIDVIYDEDICDLDELLNIAEENEDDVFVRVIKRFIQENGLEEEEDD